MGITSGILLYTAFKLDDRHTLLKFFTIFIAILMLMIIPRAIIDYPTNCSIVVGTQNISSVVGTHITNTTTSLGYTTYCGTQKDSGTILLQGQMFMFYIMIVYTFFFLIWMGIQYIKERHRLK